jgi:acyl-CoA synthetase (AMP-forming)/AMP-acid ligase II
MQCPELTRGIETLHTPDSSSSFLDVLDEAFARWGERVCVQFGARKYTYREVGEFSARIANQLLSSGFQPGNKGAVYSLNSADSFIATLGIIRAGGIWIPVNPRNSTTDNISVMLQFECDAIIYQEVYAEPIAEVRMQSTGDPIVACLDNHTGEAPYLRDWCAGADDGRPSVTVAPQDLISIPLTGGTTGLPKGAMLTHANFCALDYSSRYSLESRGEQDPVWLCAAPMTHVGGRIALTNMSSGGRFVVLDKVDLQEVLSAIERERITHMFLPPTAVYTLLDQPNLQDFDLSSLKCIGYGSAPISIEKLKQALRVLGPVMRGGYGQTECPMSISVLQQEDHFDDQGNIVSDKRLSSVGKATVISTLAILDKEGNEQPANALGEIAVKGGGVCLGYYNSPEETEKIRLNGWHLTGDIGYLDEDGFLYIVDRKKDMIITGGFNVYSAEVERALMSLPGIKVAVVIGIPSDKWGEKVHALAQLEEGSKLTAEDILDFARQRLGGVKAPKSVEFVDDLPRTPIGKIDKKVLRAAYWEGEMRKL